MQLYQQQFWQEYEMQISQLAKFTQYYELSLPKGITANSVGANVAILFEIITMFSVKMRPQK